MSREIEVKTPSWRQTTVNVATSEGMEPAPAITHEWCPGLAVTMHQFGVYRVTHIASGRAIGGRYERVGSACLELAEWVAIGRAYGVPFETDDTAALAAAINTHGDQPVPFDGATTTTGGVKAPMTLTDWAGLVRGNQPDDEFPWESYDDTSAYHADRLIATFAPNAEASQ